ncbi:MAG: Rieske (2Fe-2S) protein [Kiloniellaceae bacterium]
MSHALAGTPLCRLDEIADGEARGFVLGSGDDALLIFVVRQGDSAYAYRNACPHQNTPLDWGGFRDDGHFISFDSGNILCATHGAEFRVEDGFCLWGPCAGYSLQAVEISRDARGDARGDAPGDDPGDAPGAREGLLRFQGLKPPLPGPGGGPSR